MRDGDNDVNLRGLDYQHPFTSQIMNKGFEFREQIEDTEAASICPEFYNATIDHLCGCGAFESTC